MERIEQGGIVGSFRHGARLIARNAVKYSELFLKENMLISAELVFDELVSYLNSTRLTLSYVIS